MKHSALPLPGEALSALWGRVPGYIRKTFCAAVILGLAAHLYLFANKLPNHDDVGHLFSASYGTPSGRWLLPTVLQWDGSYSMPWLIGILAILCLALTACLTVSLLRIRSTPGCVVTAGLLVSFPSWAATFSYLFTADAYCLSALLAAFAAYTAVRHRRWGIPLGVLALACSMGIYQSYFPVTAVLMVGALLLETLDGKQSLRQLLLRGVRLAAILALGMAVYLVMVRLTTRDSGLVDYMGISSMGQLTWSQLPSLLWKCYHEYWLLFARNSYGFHLPIVKPLVLLAGLLTAALLVWVLKRRHLGAGRTVLALVLVLLYPLAGNLIHVMTNGMRVHSLMIFGMAFLPIAPVALVEYAARHLHLPPFRQRTVQALCSWVILGAMAVTAFSYVVLDNSAYLKMQITFDQGMAYSNRLLSAVENCDGYERGLDLVLVGSNAYTGDLYPTPSLNAVQLTGVLGLADLRTSYTYGYFLKYYLGFTDPVYLYDSDRAQALAETDEVAAMPVYPDDGSVRRIGDAIVVKLGEPS